MDAKKDSEPDRKSRLRELDRKVAQQLDELLEDVIKARVEPFIDNKVNDVDSRIGSVEGKLSQKIADSEGRLRTRLTTQVEENRQTMTEAQSNLMKVVQCQFVEASNQMNAQRDQVLTELQRVERKLFYAIMAVIALIILAIGGFAVGDVFSR